MYARLQFALWFAIVVLLPLWLFAVLLTARAAELGQTARRWGSNLHSQEHEDEVTTNPALLRLCAALLSSILFASWLFKKVNSVFSCRRCWSTPSSSSTTAKNGKNYERPTISRCSTFVARLSFTASFTIAVLLVFSARIFDEPLERAFFEQYPPGALEGKSVLITGANSGVGLETAQWAAHWGRAEVLYLGTRNKKKCEQAKREILKAAGDEARRKQRQRAAELYYGAGRTSEDPRTPRPTPAPRAQTTRLRCFEFDLLPFGRKRDARRIQRGWKNSLPPGAKVDILVNNAGFAAGTRHDAMYVSHKILQRALQKDNNPKLRTVTVASLTAFFCTPGLVETLRTAYSVWYFRWREWGLGAFLSSGGAPADWGYDRAVFPADEITEAVFVPSAPPTAPMGGKMKSTSKFTTRQGARQWRSLADRYAYPRVKYWQMLGAEEKEIAIGLAFVKTSINPDLMDSFVGLFMRQADIGALPIVKAMLVGDGAVKRAREEVLFGSRRSERFFSDQEEGAEVVAGGDDQQMLGTRDSSPQTIKEVEERDTLKSTEAETMSAAAADLPDDVVLEHDVAGSAKEASSPGASALGSVLVGPVVGFVQQPVFTQISPQLQSQLLALLERVAASEQLAAAAEVVASAVTGVYGRAKYIVLEKILTPARGPLAEFLNATVNKPKEKIKRRFTSVCVMHQLFVQDCFSESGWWGTDQQYLEDSRDRLENYLQTFFSATSRSDGRDGAEAMVTSAEEDEDVVEVLARRRKELLDALEEDTG
eukprot:g17263.t1